MTARDLTKIVAIFNSSTSWAEFLINLDLLDVKLNDLEEMYTTEVASSFKTFLDKFLDKKTRRFSLKKFFDQSVVNDAVRGSKFKFLLPSRIYVEANPDMTCIIFSAETKDHNIKHCTLKIDTEVDRLIADYNIDILAEGLNTLMHEFVVSCDEEHLDGGMQ